VKATDDGHAAAHEHTRQEVAPEFIGSEVVLGAGRLQRGRHQRIGIMRDDPGSE
jgi:hypothetical protein